jgi:dCMP deaminase
MGLDKDIQFMRMAKEVSRRSKCSSRQIGAVLVKDGSIVSEGYNGAPRGVNLCQNHLDECLRRKKGFASGEGLEYCPAVHAEMNAIVQAARNGIQTKGTTLYCYCERPCKWCMSIIINAGVDRVVCFEGNYDNLSGVMAEDSGIVVYRVNKEDI